MSSTPHLQPWCLPLILTQILFAFTGCNSASTPQGGKNPATASQPQRKIPMPEIEERQFLKFLLPTTSEQPLVSEHMNLLHGTWQVIAAEEDGKAVTLPHFKLPGVVEFSSKQPPNINLRCDLYTIELQPDCKPHRLTATVTGGEIKGTKMLGIYKFEAKRLIIRLHYDTEIFPTTFKTKAQDSTFLLILTRNEL